jgi:glycosyltransferase involved in cell wall biosynthesis
MRLFVDAHILDDLGQGSKTYLKGLYSAALTQNVDADFYFATNTLDSFEKEFGGSPRAHRLAYSSHNKFLRLGIEMPSLIRRNKIDWAHFQYISPLVKSCHELVTIHDLLFLDYPEYFPRSYRLTKDFLFRRSARRAEYVLTVSEFSKEALQRHYNIAPERIIITPNAVLDFFWEKEHVTSDIFVKHGLDQFILYVSRFEPRKNQAGLLQSYIDLKLWNDGVKLVLVGGMGVESREFDRLYASLEPRVRNMVLIIRDVSLSDLKWLYMNCKLFVYPSFAEGFGIPPLEAIACGANVICSGSTAMAEFKFLGNRLFDPRNSGAMTEKIGYFIERPQRESLHSMQDYVRMRYSWKSAANNLLQVLV